VLTSSRTSKLRLLYSDPQHLWLDLVSVRRNPRLRTDRRSDGTISICERHSWDGTRRDVSALHIDVKDVVFVPQYNFNLDLLGTV
jgi:hypothetical protein